jgi:hypothetical protein
MQIMQLIKIKGKFSLEDVLILVNWTRSHG